MGPKLIAPVLKYDFRLSLIKADQREIRAILRASLTPVQQNEAERRGNYAVLGLCRCGKPADHGNFCLDCAELINDDLNDRMREGE